MNFDRFSPVDHEYMHGLLFWPPFPPKIKTALPALGLSETIIVYALPPFIKSKKFPNKSSGPQLSFAVLFSVEVSRRQTPTKKSVT